MVPLISLSTIGIESLCLSSQTSTFNFSIIFSSYWGDNWTFEIALFFIFFTLSANLKDWMLSSKCLLDLLVVQIKAVLEFPPRLSRRSCVNLESLKGTKDPGGPPRAVITLPSVVKLILIFLASSSTLPVAPVLPILSEPARSTRLSLAPFLEPS